MASHPDLAAEQAYIDNAYSSLERSREEATRLRSMVEVGKGGTEQARWEREMIEGNIAQRLASLQLGDASLVFGRIDRTSREGGDSYYIGRLAVSDEHREPLVVDWRAPVAEPFYRATGREPMGLVRRRHFATRGRQLLAIEDELFGESAGLLGGELAVVDDGREIRGQQHADRRPRGGPHRPAVRHRRHDPGRAGRDHPRRAARRARGAGRPRHRQDGRRAPPRRLPPLHAPLPARGPGRARRRPQPALPRLHRAGAAEPRRGRRGAGRARRPPRRHHRRRPSRAATARSRPGSRATCAWPRCWPRPCTTGSARCGARCASATACRRSASRPSQSQAIVADAKRRFRLHNAGRRHVEASVFATLADSARVPVEAHEVRERLRHAPEVREALERMWPVLTPADLLHDLFGSAALIALAAGRSLSPAEQAALVRPRAEHVEDAVWTVDDVPLLDEARALLGPKPKVKRPGPARRRRGAHLRPHRRRRGAGPLADAAAHAHPPLAQRLDDRRGRHRPVHRRVGPRRLGRGARAAARPPPGPPHRAHHRLPPPGPEHGAGHQGAGARRARPHAAVARCARRARSPASSRRRPGGIAAAVVEQALIERRRRRPRQRGGHRARLARSARSPPPSRSRASSSAGPPATASTARSPSCRSAWSRASSSTPPSWSSRPPSSRRRCRAPARSTSRSPAPPSASCSCHERAAARRLRGAGGSSSDGDEDALAGEGADADVAAVRPRRWWCRRATRR